MRQLKISTTYSLMVFMVDSGDHITGKTGLTLAISSSKNGAAFVGISPVVTERSFGWYSVALTIGMTDTEGDLALHITAVGADPNDEVSQVRTRSLSEMSTSVQAVKIQAAVYDTLTRSENVLTLSNGVTQTIDSTGRTTA